jgi:hypothetical protein
MKLFFNHFMHNTRHALQFEHDYKSRNAKGAWKAIRKSARDGRTRPRRF